MSTLRDRVRAEMISEIKAVARAQIAAGGAAHLSLRAVARELELVSSALYRYFASRDELLTALIIDAYDALGTAAETAEAGVDRADLAGRFAATCHGVRHWAVAHPHEYGLIYGTPVPGYAAPQDTVGPANRVVVVLGQILADGVGAGVLRPQPGDWLSPTVAADISRAAAAIELDLPPTILARGMIAWTELFGAVSFELFGRLNGVIDNHQAWFDHQVLTLARLVGLRP